MTSIKPRARPLYHEICDNIPIKYYIQIDRGLICIKSIHVQNLPKHVGEVIMMMMMMMMMMIMMTITEMELVAVMFSTFDAEIQPLKFRNG